MANPELLAIVKQGAKVWNQWRVQHCNVTPHLLRAELGDLNLEGVNLSGASLREADFRGAYLENASFFGADLEGARFDEADLTGANMRESDLSKANLNRSNLTETHLIRANFRRATLEAAMLTAANLRESNFFEANLRAVDFSEADLREVDFNSADVRQANFGGSRMGGTGLINVDLSTTKELLSVRHYSPSTIGIDTIYKSKGEIPSGFLNGCGVPRQFLSQIESLLSDPNAYSSCFICYSSHDEDVADHLYHCLRAQGVVCWYAPDAMQGGRKIMEQLDRAINNHDRFLLVLSEHSIKSSWVKTELYKAHKREVQQNQRVLFPISLMPMGELEKWEAFDVDTGTDIARAIREYHIPDFSMWKEPSAFDGKFKQLLRGLRVNTPSIDQRWQAGKIYLTYGQAGR